MARGSPRQRSHYDDYAEEGGGYLTLRSKIYVLVMLGLSAHIVSMLRSPKISSTLNNTLLTIKNQNNGLPKGVDPLTWNQEVEQGATLNIISQSEPQPFQPSPYDYYAVPVRTELTLPDPLLSSPRSQGGKRLMNQTHTNTNTSNLLVLVMSARENFERRQIIRDTWAKGYSNNVLFVVGGPPDAHAAKDPTDSVTIKLFHEQKMHQDLLDTLLPESYRALPYKLHYSFQWIWNQTNNNHTHDENNNDNNNNDQESMSSSFWKRFEWYLKVDDDVVVRMQRLEKLILQKYNPRHPMVIGNIVEHAPKATEGKWAEDPHYTPSFYPPWPRGSTGYVLSRPVAEYLGHTASQLHYYQGEDAGLGIWLEEGHAAFNGDLTWIHTPEFAFETGCDRPYAVTGHDMNPEAIHKCFWEHGGDTVPEHKSRVYRHEAPVKLFTHVALWESSLWGDSINDVDNDDHVDEDNEGSEVSPWDGQR